MEHFYQGLHYFLRTRPFKIILVDICINKVRIKLTVLLALYATSNVNSGYQRRHISRAASERVQARSGCCSWYPDNRGQFSYKILGFLQYLYIIYVLMYNKNESILLYDFLNCREMFLCPFFFYACSLTSKIGIVQKNTWCLASQNTQAVRYTVNKLYLCCVNYHVVLLQKEEMPVSSWLILSCEIKCTVFADIKLVSQMRALLKKIKPYLWFVFLQTMHVKYFLSGSFVCEELKT